MSFDHLAPHYRWMERVLAGNLLHRVRTCWLGDIDAPKRVLFAGEGPGRMLEACVKTFSRCDFTVLDQSHAMLQQAQHRIQRHRETAHTFRFEQTDLRAPSPNMGPFDLIITNFVLDCFAPDDLAKVIHHLAATGSPKAQWLLADFCVPSHGWQRMRAKLILWIAYRFFRCATNLPARAITPPDNFLIAHGFQLDRRQHFSHGLLHADLWKRS